MSKSGNLTLAFNRPFEVPEVYKDAVVDVHRNLGEQVMEASDFIEIFVNSPINEEDAEAMNIDDYYLTRFTDMAFDI